MTVSRALHGPERAILGLDGVSVLPIAAGHQKYLAWHRARVFKV